MLQYPKNFSAIEMIPQNMIIHKGSKNFVVCAREGGANTTPYFLTAHFAEQKILTCFLLLQNTNSGGGGKRGRAKIHSPQPPFFLPARAFRILCAARSAASRQFLGISDKMGSSQIVKTHQYRTKRLKWQEMSRMDFFYF